MFDQLSYLDMSRTNWEVKARVTGQSQTHLQEVMQLRVTI